MRNQVSLILFFLICYSWGVTTSKVQVRHHLNRGASLSVEDDSNFITSPDNTFTCGFYSVGTNAYWFAIWFTNSRDRTVVWMANRDRPVSGKGSKVTLRGDGIIVLTDIDGMVTWVTNTSSTDANRVELLKTGNLVLKNPQGEILWQSFDFPTDTLLPSQLFTKSSRLIASSRKGTFQSGYHSLYYDSDNVLRMIFDGPEISSIYWPNPDWDVYRNGRTNYNSSRIAFMDAMGRFYSSDRLQFNSSDLGFGIQRRLTLDYDGNLRVYSLQNTTGLWEISWQALAQPCNVRGRCGRYGICTYTPEAVKCSCPPGYVISEPSDWRQGCRARFNHSGTNFRSPQVKFIELRNTDYYGFDLNFSSPISFEACRDICSEDERCEAFSYRLTGAGLCFAKSALFNGYMSSDFPGSIYLKLPRLVEVSEPVILKGSGVMCDTSQAVTLVGSSSMYDTNGKRARWVYLYSFSAAIGAIETLFFLLGWWCLFRKHGLPSSVEDGYHMISSQFRRFSYAELKKATKGFTEELGKGSSGLVYKGVLADGRVVAVKRLRDVFQAEEEFWAEMSTIGKIYHMNLLRMWGFCSEGRHRLLIYEYVENSSLDKQLFTSKFLQWKQRYAVALGAAKGLAYLHHECLEWVIHCDVKPENILLDSEFQPKIADFGLAKLSQRGDPDSQFTRIRGTKGYLAPEWALNRPITAKVDVYGYGVVILEMVKGVRLSNWVVDDSNVQEAALTQFIRMVKGKIQSGEDDSWLEGIVDPRLQGKFSRNQVATLIQIGLSCVEEDRNKRPTMASIVQTLLECEE